MQWRILSEQDIRAVDEATLDILEEAGVWIGDCPPAVEVFRQVGCTLDGERVRIPRPLVRDSLAALPDRNDLKLCTVMLGFAEPVGLKRAEVHFGLIGNPYYLYDFEKGRRDLVDTDQHDKDLLLDHLPNFEFDACGIIPASQRQRGPATFRYDTPEDCIRFLQSRIHRRRAAAGRKLPLGVAIPHKDISNPRVMGHRNSTAPLARLETLGHMIIHGPHQTEALLSQDTPLVWCNPISPLKLHPEQLLEIMQAVEEHGQRCFVMISPEVLGGASAPVTLAGALAQHNAEVLAGLVFAQLCRPGTPVIYGCVSGVFDMRTAEPSLGSLESVALNLAAAQMADHYGLPSRIQAGNTSAPKPGVRAAVETALGTQMALAAGANLVTTGLLDCTLMLSYEHLVLQDELIGQLRGAVEGVSADKDHLAKDVIVQEALGSAGYLAHDHTLRHMKEAVYYSDFTGRTAKSYEDWYDLAHEKVRQIFARRDHGEGDLDQAVADRAAAVAARLKQDNTTWRVEKHEWWKSYVRELV